MRTSEPRRSELASVVALIGKQGGQPSAYWSQCDNPSCRRLTPRSAYAAALSVCQQCGRHGAVGARERIRQVTDAGTFVEHDAELAPLDPLEFVADAQPYRDKLRQVQHRTGEPEGAVGGSATIGEHAVEIVVLDFAFMGGTLSCVVGEKVARAAERARARASALITINTSGGARMHEGLLALMQLGKTVTSLSCLAAAGVPHVSVLANPTLGGVTASYAGIGDVLIAESGALVGFAGPRVIEQITRQPLPSDAQRAAFLLEHGMADLVLERKALRPMLIALLQLYAARRASPGRASRPASLPLVPAGSRERPDAWAQVQLARERGRPTTLEYAQLAFDSFVELHGDRLFADDPAVVGGLAALDGRTIMLIGHQRGRTTREAGFRHFGMARPEGYRKALRLMRHAERFGLPVVTLVDTPGADPSLESEERGQAFAIAHNLFAMSELRVPLVSVVCGEGGSGGALALALADRVLMLENAVYSVASPEAAASILWRDASRGPEAARALKITADDALRLGVVDGIVGEPPGGAHLDHATTAHALRQALSAHLDSLTQVSKADLVERRLARYRHVDSAVPGGPMIASPVIRTRSFLAACALMGAQVLAGCSPQRAATPPPTPVAAAPVAAESVRRGPIQRALAYSGEIRAREQISVLPRASGRLDRVLVDVGSRVRAGDVLAVMDQESARIAAAQARASLAAAEAKLASIQAGPRPDDVAAAEAALIQQQVKLVSMQNGGRPDDIQFAQSALQAQQAKLDLMLQGGRPEAVRQAQAALDGARAKLEAVQKGPGQDVLQAAQSAVVADRAALASAEAAHAALGGSNAADLRAAQSAVQAIAAQVHAARAAVASADVALKSLQGSGAADVQQAQSALDAAVAQLATAQASAHEGRHPTQAQIAQAGATLAAARAERQQAQAQQTALEKGAAPPCADSVQAPRNADACGAAKASADATVAAADAAVEAAQGQIDLRTRGGSPAEQAQLKAAVDEAQANIAAARTRLEAIKNGGLDAQRAELQAARDAAHGQLVAAEQDLGVADAQLSAIQNGTHDAQVKAANAQVTAARERLKSDEARLEILSAGATDEDLRQAQATVTQTTEQLALARRPSTEHDIQAQRAAVDQARQQLQKAREPHTGFELEQQAQAVAQAAAALRARQAPFTDEDLSAARASVEQARAAVELAELAVRESNVIAPVEGVIADRLASAGAVVSPQTPIVTLTPPSLELVVNVDEGQLGALAQNQSVQLAVPAFPGQTFVGSVRSIAPSVDSKTRTVPVRIEPRDDDGQLRPGMFARVAIVTAVKDDALLVPREAILGDTGGAGPSVFAIDIAGRVRRQPVTLGIQNDESAEIVRGLEFGQLVATGSLSELVEGDVVAPQVNNRLAYVR